MLSTSERIRTGVEWLLRAIALALLLWCLAQALGVGAKERTEVAGSAELRAALERWTTVSAPTRAHAALEHPPTRLEQDWLAALSRAGTAIEWSGPSLLPTAIAIEPRADPAGGADVTVAAPPGSTVVLRDTLGVLDTLDADAYGVRAYVARPRATIDAVVGPTVARAAPHDSLVLGRLLVIGAAGWESKFVIAALEERGWKVDSHVVVSPETAVRQGRTAAIDTTRYAAVLALDTTAAQYADRIARYVRSGGGLVLWSPAAAARGLANLAAGKPGAVIDDEGRAPRDDAPRNDLALAPITALAPDAVPLEHRGGDIAVAARRVGAGRVVQNGYVNSWRWRMAGGDDAPERHRAWLAGLVSRVAYTGRVALEPPPIDPAPVAALVERLGPPAPALDPNHVAAPNALAPWIFAALCAAFLLEWLSRRTRGAK